MKNRTKKIINVILSLILIITISGGIILATQMLYKINHKTQEDIMAEKNKVVLGEESVLYIDLTKKPDDYEKIAKMEDSRQETKKEVQEQNTDDIQNIMNEINQDNYETEINLDSGKLIANGEEKDISNIINTAEEKENLYNYLKENTIGDIKYENGKIKVENPYSTKTLIMETDNLTQLQNCGNIESVVKVSDNIYCVHYKDAKDTKEGYDILKNNDLINRVSTDIQVSISEDTNTNLKEINVNNLQVTGDNWAWGVSTTGLSQLRNKLNYAENNTNVKVAVLDTGIRTTHEVFKNETTSDRLDLTDAYNYVGSSTDVTDDNGHGTMVAGIIAESTSNNVKIVPVKVLGSNGKGNFSTVIEAMSAIIEKVDVVNLSFGVADSEVPDSARTLIEDALKTVYDSGKIIVCASGNDGTEGVYYPSSSPYTIAVSAIDYEKNIASFSNYGSTVDFAAPGQALILPYYTGDNLYNASFDPSSEEYKKNSGTSFAAPFVASAFAMVLSENKNATVEELKNILKENCEDLGASGKDNYYGYGSINFDTNMFRKPVIANTKVSTKWAKENKIELYAVCGNKITKWGYTTIDEQPQESEWQSFDTPAKAVHIVLTTTQNEKYYLWVKDESGNVVKQEATTQKTDNTAPEITNEIAVQSNENAIITCNLSVRDTESGISKIEWFYKKDSDTDYQKYTDNCTISSDGTGETGIIEKSHTFNELESNTTYSFYATIYDVAENSVSTQVIEETISNKIVDDNTVNTNNTTGNINDNNTITNTTNETNTNTNTNTNTTNETNTNTQNTSNTTENTMNTSNTNSENTNTSSNNTENQTSNTNNSFNNTIIAPTNTNANNTTNKNITTIKATKDNTTISKILPKTGESKIILLLIIVIIVSGIFTLVKYNKMKDVK